MIDSKTRAKVGPRARTDFKKPKIVKSGIPKTLLFYVIDELFYAVVLIGIKSLSDITGDSGAI